MYVNMRGISVSISVRNGGSFSVGVMVMFGEEFMCWGICGRSVNVYECGSVRCNKKGHGYEDNLNKNHMSH